MFNLLLHVEHFVANKISTFFTLCKTFDVLWSVPPSLPSSIPISSLHFSLMLCPVAVTSYFVFVVVSVLFSGTLGIQETLLKSMQEIFASMHCPRYSLPLALTELRRGEYIVYERELCMCYDS